MKRYIVFVGAMSTLGLAIGIVFGVPRHSHMRLYPRPTSRTVPERHIHIYIHRSQPVGPPAIGPVRVVPSHPVPPNLAPVVPPQPVVTLIGQGQHG